jgi:hypothetical protein
MRKSVVVWCRVQGAGCRVWSAGCRVQGVGFFLGGLHACMLESIIAMESNVKAMSQKVRMRANYSLLLLLLL